MPNPYTHPHNCKAGEEEVRGRGVRDAAGLCGFFCVVLLAEKVPLRGRPKNLAKKNLAVNTHKGGVHRDGGPGILAMNKRQYWR